MTTKQDVLKELKAITQNSSHPLHVFSRALVNAFDHCLVAIDHQGIIFLSNGLAEEKLGVTQHSELKHHLPELNEKANRTITSGISQKNFNFRIKSEEYMVSIKPIKMGQNLIGALIILKDSTSYEDLVKQMHFFQNTTRELDAIIDSSSDGLFVCDGQANVIRMNPASEKIHNTREKDLKGRNMANLIEEGFIDSSAALEVCQKKKTVRLLQNKDNRKLISIGRPVFNKQGELIRVVVSERDMTQIDHLQRELEEQASIQDLLKHQLLQMQIAELKTNQIVARSPSMLKVIEGAHKVSNVDSSVLITGESGVGKGVIVNLIHNHSKRAKKPLIRINCGALPETLIESELFGYEAGAFTGARAGGKPGSLELADHGSVFLDEIAELPLTAQVKLLRFLENGRMTRLGGSKSFTVDARILVATHRDLKKMVAQGTFRQDLYYRLNVIPIHVPPLRERHDCILPMLRYFVDHFASMVGTEKRLGRAALNCLMAYPFPGNVRELMNICERMVVMSETQVIDLADLPGDVARCSTANPVIVPAGSEQQTLEDTLNKVEKQVLIQALETHENQTKAAAALGISQPTIARRLKKYNLT